MRSVLASVVLSSFVLLLLLGLSVPVAIAEPSPEPPDPNSEAKDIQGHWTVERIEIDGMAMPLPLKDIKFELIISKNKMTIKMQGMEKTATIKVNPKKKPAEMDVTLDDDKKVSQCIYKIEKGELTLAFGEPGKERPKDFKGGMRSPIMVLKREKK